MLSSPLFIARVWTLEWGGSKSQCMQLGGAVGIQSFHTAYDMASFNSNSNEKGNDLSPTLNFGHQTHEVRSYDTENRDMKDKFAETENACNENILIKLGNEDKNNEVDKGVSKPAFKRKKVVSRQKTRRYPLRSSLGGGRTLRSRSKTKCNTQPEPGKTPVNPVTKRRRKRRRTKRASNDEFSMIKKRVRYVLQRMKYEQNLIDAYSAEGWKGQSAEKLRPEKELERAKSEILRCKFKIRELFRHLDSLSSEGRFEESLFDSEGQIDSEDIFCAKCGLKDLSADNDIILCDGVCDRGFHQKCLNPPLLSEDIPTGDEGWLCPSCDCKVDCIELLDEFQGSKMSIKDSWKKVFPEADAITNGDNKDNDLPSEDSGDFNYDPDGRESDAEDNNEESDFKSSSEDSDASNNDMQNENLGLLSDDSEDDDFDPDAPDLDKIQKDGSSSSDESDFTSDSDEFCNELCKTSGVNEVSESGLRNTEPLAKSDGVCTIGTNNSEHLSMSETDLNQESVLVSNKRQLERLDYKKLYDETYGNLSSDSSNDEDWSESANVITPNGGKKYGKRKESNGPPNVNDQTIKNRKYSNNAVEYEAGEQNHGSQESDSTANKNSASASKRFGEITTQKLYASFQEDQYPSREKKESLARELGLSFRQVDKWFGNSRHSFRVSNKPVPHAGVPSPNKESNRANRKTKRSSIKPDDNVGNSSLTDGDGQLVLAKKPEVGLKDGEGEHGLKGDTEQRDKAIARELKKMKQGR